MTLPSEQRGEVVIMKEYAGLKFRENSWKALNYLGKHREVEMYYGLEALEESLLERK